MKKKNEYGLRTTKEETPKGMWKKKHIYAYVLLGNLERMAAAEGRTTNENKYKKNKKTEHTAKRAKTFIKL